MATDLSTTNFLGLDFVNADYVEIAGELDRLSRSGPAALVATPNVDHVVMLEGPSQDTATVLFREAIADAALLACDSRILQALAILRGIALKVATGSDLTVFLFENGHLDRRNVAIVGGDAAMLDELRQRYPAIRLAQHIPPMGVLNNETAMQAIERFVAENAFDYIFFAMGAPRSEIIAHRCMRVEGAAGVILCVGASIEFLLGRKARAPQLLQRLRLEWAFRLALEPRRLWRRYLVTGPRIFWIVMSWRKPSAG